MYKWTRVFLAILLLVTLVTSCKGDPLPEDPLVTELNSLIGKETLPDHTEYPVKLAIQTVDISLPFYSYIEGDVILLLPEGSSNIDVDRLQKLNKYDPCKFSVRFLEEKVSQEWKFDECMTVKNIEVYIGKISYRLP